MRCENCDINTLIERIIRTKLVCADCFEALRKDNWKLINSGKEIPNNLTIQKKCSSPSCRKKFLEEPKYTVVEVGRVPKTPFCSKECEESYKKQLLD